MIQEAHRSERKVCGHARTTHALLPCADGTVQIRLTCVDCGHRVGGPERNVDHPNRRSYPTIQLCGDIDRRGPQAAITPDEYPDYIVSQRWRTRRAYYVAKALGKCQLCDKPGGPNGSGLNVHHRTYERLGCEFDSDVIVLCRPCHDLFHSKLPAQQGTLSASEWGDVIKARLSA